MINDMRYVVCIFCCFMNLFLPLDCFSVEIVSKYEVTDGGSNRYAAFPSLFYLSDGKSLGFSVVARNIISHHDARGEQINLLSSNCGASWGKTETLPPAAIFLGNKSDEYLRIKAIGWKVESKESLSKTDVFFRQEHGQVYSSIGVVEQKSLDGGKSWFSKQNPLVPKHAVIMNYNESSNVKMSSGSHITALYYKSMPLDKSQVLFAISSATGSDFKFVTLPNPADGVGLDETAIAELPNGDVVAFSRPDPDKVGYLYYSLSHDGGETWSVPVRTEVFGYPASLVVSGDRLVVTVGVRRVKPYSIDVYVFSQKGMNMTEHFKLATELGNNASNFGYPITLKCQNLFVTTYYREANGAVGPVILTWKMSE